MFVSFYWSWCGSWFNVYYNRTKMKHFQWQGDNNNNIIMDKQFININTTKHLPIASKPKSIETNNNKKMKKKFCFWLLLCILYVCICARFSFIMFINWIILCWRNFSDNKPEIIAQVNWMNARKKKKQLMWS